MQSLAAVAVVGILFLLPIAVDGHDINKILDKFPDFSTFSDFLTQTQLSADINRRRTITILAVNNAGMTDLAKKPIDVIRNVLSLHVLLDYYDDKRLHSLTNGTELTATVYQSSGLGPGTAGIVNITDVKGGKVVFTAKDDDSAPATLVKSLNEQPFNISVVQVSNPLPPPVSLAPPMPPSPAPAPAAPIPLPSKWNFTDFMSGKGCKAFAEALSANIPAYNSFASSVEGGLTILCPGDDAMKKLFSRFKNLTRGDQQSLLEYHGTPVYQSVDSLRSANTPKMSTLATDGAGSYGFSVSGDGTDVSFSTGIVTAKIAGVVKDEQPLAIFMLDTVLLPKELFKAAPGPGPSPAEPPKMVNNSSPPLPAPDTQADAPQTDVADSPPKSNGAVSIDGGKLGALILALLVIIVI